MERMNENIETSKPVAYLLLERAEGSIEAGPHQEERLDEATDRLKQGEFHRKAESRSLCKCIDGRCGGLGFHPNAAGGTETLMVADDLTYKSMATSDGTTAGAFRRTVAHAKNSDMLVGGHTDDHSGAEKSGCGANDKLEDIYKFISRNSTHLRGLTESLGMDVSNETNDMIQMNAAERTQFSSGPEMLSVFGEDPDARIETLEGSHKEVIAVINTKEGTTFDRYAFKEEFGPDYQAFNVDVWAFKEAAAAFTDSTEEQAAFVVAMVYYNLATAHVLCGKKMRVIVL